VDQAFPAHPLFLFELALLKPQSVIEIAVLKGWIFLNPPFLHSSATTSMSFGTRRYLILPRYPEK